MEQTLTKEKTGRDVEEETERVTAKGSHWKRCGF